MDLVFIHGPAACGKLTVARELGARTGFRVFHNHLVVDLVSALFEFGSEPFVRLRERLWMESFREAATCGESLIFTFQPEASVEPGFPERVVELIESLGGKVAFVSLVCDESVVEARVESASRAEFGKLRSLADYRRLRDDGAFDYPPMPSSRVELDTGALPPAEAAAAIAVALRDGKGC